MDLVHIDLLVRHNHELYLDFQYNLQDMYILQIHFLRRNTVYLVHMVMDHMVLMEYGMVYVVEFLQIQEDRNMLVDHCFDGNHYLDHMDLDDIHHLRELKKKRKNLVSGVVGNFLFNTYCNF